MLVHGEEHPIVLATKSSVHLSMLYSLSSMQGFSGVLMRCRLLSRTDATPWVSEAATKLDSKKCTYDSHDHSMLSKGCQYF